MANRRAWKKRQKVENQRVLDNMEKVLSQYYGSYLEMQKNTEKKYLNQLISIREMLERDNLETYVHEVTNILENNGVEILEYEQLDMFDSNTMEPLKRIDVPDQRYHNRIYKIYRSGYMWNGKVLRKAKVDVLIAHD